MRVSTGRQVTKPAIVTKWLQTPADKFIDAGSTRGERDAGI
jgi:hypothetical protein